MKNKIKFFLFASFFIFALISCDSLFGTNTNSNSKINITKSGLKENKYLSGTISDCPAEITLDASSATFFAKVDTNSSSRSAATYIGYFVYNHSTKNLFLLFTANSSCLKAIVDLTGTKGSTEESKVSGVEFSSSSRTEFDVAVEAVSILSDDPGDDINDDNPGDDINDDNPDVDTKDFLQLVVDEMNFARTKPKQYVTERLMPLVGTNTSSATYSSYLDSCISDMNSMTPVNELKLERGGLSKSAQEWCDIQGKHSKSDKTFIGHEGLGSVLPKTDRTLWERMTQYFTYKSAGENIAYGTVYSPDATPEKTARDVIIALLIDDGVEDLGHRHNILDVKVDFDAAGVGYGPHGFFGTMITINYASGYNEITFTKKEITLDPPDEAISPEVDDEFNFIYYDDNAVYADFPSVNGNGSYNEWQDAEIGEWVVKRDPKKLFFDFYPKDKLDQRFSSARFDPYLQIWIWRKPYYFTERYSDYNGLAYNNSGIQDFDIDQAEILSSLITVDSSIPLDRDFDIEKDYNTTFIPLSQKDQMLSYYNNYDWQQDEEFAKFVQWMQKHNVPQSRIDFYTTMAKFPLQRGKSVPSNSINTGALEKLVGMDLLGQMGPELMHITGGMEKFFYLRRHDGEILRTKPLKNETVPVLFLYIANSEEEKLGTDWDEYCENAESLLESSGLPNDFEVYTREIVIDYDEYKSDQNSLYSQNGISGHDFRTEEFDYITQKINAAYPELSEKFSDIDECYIVEIMTYNKSFVKLTDGNYFTGFTFGTTSLLTVLDLEPVTGATCDTHKNIFGEQLANEGAACIYNRLPANHGDGLCPLCLYALGVE